MTESVELKGYCPVSYFVAGKAREGRAEFSATHEGKTYHFADDEAMREFERTPDKYIPAYGGLCAFGMSIDKEFEACPKNFKIINDKLYVFLHNKDTNALTLWNNEDESRCLSNADRRWLSQQDS